MPNQSRAQRLLVVDDEATLTFFLKKDLQACTPRFTVDIAASGEDALKKLTYDRYDLLITDLNMPGISGFTLVEVARSLYPDIKIILMTAFGSPQVENEAESLAVDGYLTKPFPTAQLRDMVIDTLNLSMQSTISTQINPTNQSGA